LISIYEGGHAEMMDGNGIGRIGVGRESYITTKILISFRGKLNKK
jgi:hypothetical protein